MKTRSYRGRGRKLSWMVVVLTLLALLIANTATIQAVQIGNHQVDFIAVEYNTPGSNQSTWYYKVTSGSGPAISHVTFALGTCATIVDAGTWNGTSTNSRTSGGDRLIRRVSPRLRRAIRRRESRASNSIKVSTAVKYAIITLRWMGTMLPRTLLSR